MLSLLSQVPENDWSLSFLFLFNVSLMQHICLRRGAAARGGLGVVKPQTRKALNWCHLLLLESTFCLFISSVMVTCWLTVLTVAVSASTMYCARNRLQNMTWFVLVWVLGDPSSCYSLQEKQMRRVNQRASLWGAIFVASQGLFTESPWGWQTDLGSFVRPHDLAALLWHKR